MAEYDYECEVCGLKVTLDHPVETPYYTDHACTNNIRDRLDIDQSVLELGGAFYRVWQPTVANIKGVM